MSSVQDMSETSGCVNLNYAHNNQINSKDAPNNNELLRNSSSVPVESDTSSEESSEHDNKDHEVLGNILVKDANNHETRSNTVDRPEGQEQVILDYSYPVAVVSQSSLEENDYPEQGDINYETNGNLLGEVELECQEEEEEEEMSFGIETGEQNWPTSGELGNNPEQVSLDDKTSGNGVVEVGMDYEISEKDLGDAETDETNQNILRELHHINSTQGTSDPFQCAQDETFISHQDYFLVDNTFQQSQHITDFINLNRTSSGRYDAGLVAGQFHSSSGTLANQCAEVDASSTNETDNNGNKSISESKGEDHYDVMKTVDKFLQEFQINDSQQELICKNIELAYSGAHRPDCKKCITIKQTLDEKFHSILCSNNYITSEEDEIFKYHLNHSRQCSFGICRSPFCDSLWTSYWDHTTREYEETIQNSGIMCPSEKFDVLYTNTNIVTNQMIEGEDIKILYQQQIGGGGGGDVFDTVITMKGSFKPIRQVVKKIKAEEKSIHQAESLSNVLEIYRLGEIPQLLAPNIILKSPRVILEIMDSSGMSLHEYLKERHKQLRCESKCRKFHPNGGLPIDQFLSLFDQMMKGVEYIHRFGAHCDIKPHNFVLTRGSGEIKLIDYDGIGTENRFVTPEYQPYENFELKGRRRNYKSADIYALGCCIPEMLALAFMNLTDLGKPSRSVALQRNKTLFTQMKSVPYLEFFADVFNRCTLQEDPNARPSIHQLMQDLALSETFVKELDRLRQSVMPVMPAPEDHNFYEPPLKYSKENAKKLVSQWIRKAILDKRLDQRIPINVEPRILTC